MKKIMILLTGLMTLAACQESLEDRAARELKEYTRKVCPTPVQNYQQTDSATFDASTRTIHYYMKICGEADTATVIKQIDKQLKEGLLDDLKSNTRNKTYKDAGFNFQYTFRSEKHPTQVLFDFRFTPKDYK